MTSPEVDKIPYKLVMKIAAGLGTLLLLVVFGMRFFVDYPLVREASRLKFLRQSPFDLEPELRGMKPLLQVSPPADLKAFRAEQEKALHTYRWVDQRAGIVRIPIEQAMEYLVKRGLPTRKEGR